MVKYKAEEKLEKLKNPVVIEILYDILHKRRSKYSTTDNSGQHSEYKDMVSELDADYRREISKQSNQ